MIHLSQKLLMTFSWIHIISCCQNFFRRQNQIPGRENFMALGASLHVRAYQIWHSGSIWRVWHQTSQTDGVFLMRVLGHVVFSPPIYLGTAERCMEDDAIIKDKIDRTKI